MQSSKEKKETAFKILNLDLDDFEVNPWFSLFPWKSIIILHT